ncbi:hypothetical protein [Mycolicibacterium sp. P9-22]|uniref:hypothetical protein n=1 Tax=Mycolicibacterium sp. P9-22 TaxID=2024613 RepID=UPI0011EDA0BC|nr:hypothetical protein [Mycolicibacterium sp. P9-22]KAA0115984.1 hypothetical protein CIW51_15570 [Mycolicibacterium sp. P9-22]
MTQPPESDEPTGYMADAGVPTELAGVADANTQAAHAWAFDEDPEPEPRRFTPGRITALAVGAAVVVIAAASGIAVWFLSNDEPVAGPAPRSDLLNGVYRVEYHWDQATYREAEGNTNWGESAEAGPAQDWLSLTSACTDTDCIATGEVLGQDRERLAGARTLTFKLTNGTWQDIAPARVKSTCSYDDGSVAGESWTTVTLDFTPRPDGSFVGALTTVVDTNECGDQGNTVVTPLTAGRVGEAV